LLVYGHQQITGGATGEDGGSIAVTVTLEPDLQTQPPTPTPTATLDPRIPTATATSIICRAIVDGTSGSGLTLRDTPNGVEITILPDGSILTLLQEEPRESGGFVWRHVRTVAREEGWVVQDFLKIGDCGQ
jgi:hypothetical protein